MAVAVSAVSVEPTGVDPSVLEHPRGTLAIVAVFGLLFALGWLLMFFVTFAGRGATQS